MSQLLETQNTLPVDIPKTHGSVVSRFYDNRSILVTGATGFIGKVLLEKLLRSCPGIKAIYILVRGKRGKSSNQRLEELMSSEVFDLVKTEYPEAIKKVVPVTGDAALPSLGLSESDMATITQNVSIVFHSAATTKFDEPLKEAVDINILGTIGVVKLCHKLQRIEALIHVSTAYCNCNRSEVEEVIYPPPVEYQKIVEMTRWLESDAIESITTKVLATSNRPNTYVFTKALAENVIFKECGSLPVAVIRPSVVTASWKEPFPGWTDTLNGPTGIVLFQGKGILRTFIAHGEGTAEIIPVDVVVNLMITAAWYTAVHRPDKIMVYHCTSGGLNRSTWSSVLENSQRHITENPSAQTIGYPQLTFRRTRLSHYIHAAVEHYLPAFFTDFMAYLFFQKPGMVRLYMKIHRAADCLEHFTTNEWKFLSDNILVLNELLSEEDRQKFFLDIRDLNWNHFWKNHVLGIRKYILKEDPSTIPETRKRLRKHYILSYVAQAVFAVGAWKFLLSELLPLSKLWHLAAVIAEKINDIIQ